MPPPILITHQWLLDRGACADQAARFAALWPEGGALTRANLSRAAGADLDLTWLAPQVLTLTAERAYTEARATARRAYDEARATARLAYTEARATGPINPALLAYDEAIAPARRAYDEALVPALADALGLA